MHTMREHIELTLPRDDTIAQRSDRMTGTAGVDGITVEQFVEVPDRHSIARHGVNVSYEKG